MKDSLIVLGVFVLGICLGLTGQIPADILPKELTEWLLYALIIQMGIGLGAGGSLKKLTRSFTPNTLFLPIVTIVGTLSATAIVGLVLGGWSLSEYMAMGSGMGYYSLSSVIIMDLKTDVIGMEAATQMGVMAVMVNIFREMTALVLGPWIARHFGRYATTSAAGVTSMDVNMPMIVRCGGQDMFPIALMHGMILEMSIPLLVTLFASM